MSNEQVYRRAFEAAMRYVPPGIADDVETDQITPFIDSDDHAAMRAAWMLMQEGGDE